ncbi:MAG: PhoH family protein [Burkholderiales bacterium]|jgi:phosphate starvation-inducible PhoH-like protein|nr:PhoH family protein [Burkholderiales bacterium]
MSRKENVSASELSLELPAAGKKLQYLCGPMESHLREIEKALRVTIQHRHGTFRIQGAATDGERAAAVLQALYGQARRSLSLEEVQLVVVENTVKSAVKKTAGTTADAMADDAKSLAVTHLHTRKTALKARTPNQQAYLDAIATHDITFGVGPAGTGKTYLAVAMAVDALERDAVQRIVLVRPAVEAGERLGFLPGDLAQKVDPYLRPLYDALYDLLGFDKTLRLLERQTIEIAPLAYMRGRTLNGAFIILDEAQNTTPEQMKMFLTRVGFGAKVVVTGDITQIDLPGGQRSGLIEVETILRKVSGIAFSYFTSVDVVRHPVVQRIVEAYARHNDGAPKRTRRLPNTAVKVSHS